MSPADLSVLEREWAVVRPILGRLKVAQLKSVLRTASLRLSGVKLELQGRIISAVDDCVTGAKADVSRAQSLSARARLLVDACKKELGVYFAGDAHTYTHTSSAAINPHAHPYMNHAHTHTHSHSMGHNRYQSGGYSSMQPACPLFIPVISVSSVPIDAFYEVISSLMDPGKLQHIPSNDRSYHRGGTTLFDLTANSIHLCKSTTHLKPSMEQRYSVMLWARRLSKPSSLHCWPMETVVTCNGRDVTPTQRKVVFNGGHRKVKGTCQPLDLGQFCRAGKNRLQVNCRDTEEFVFFLQLVRSNPIERIVERVAKRTDHPSLQEATNRVKKSFHVESVDGDDGDDEVLAASTRLSLHCPLGLGVLSLPVRGKVCSHLQCFDLRTFLTMNEGFSVSRFKCGVCANIIAQQRDFVVDTFMADILVKLRSKFSEEDFPDEVEIHPDGTWTVPGHPHVHSGAFSARTDSSAAQSLLALSGDTAAAGASLAHGGGGGASPAGLITVADDDSGAASKRSAGHLPGTCGSLHRQGCPAPPATTIIAAPMRSTTLPLPQAPAPPDVIDLVSDDEDAPPPVGHAQAAPHPNPSSQLFDEQSNRPADSVPHASDEWFSDNLVDSDPESEEEVHANRAKRSRLLQQPLMPMGIPATALFEDPEPHMFF